MNKKEDSASMTAAALGEDGVAGTLSERIEILRAAEAIQKALIEQGESAAPPVNRAALFASIHAKARRERRLQIARYVLILIIVLGGLSFVARDVKAILQDRMASVTSALKGFSPE